MQTPEQMQIPEQQPAKRPSWLQLIAICLIVAAVVAMATGYFVSAKYRDTLQAAEGDYQKLNEIKALLDRYYVGTYEEKDLMDMLAVGYMSGINDKWSYYTRAEDLAALYEDKTGSYAGIGVTVTQDAETGMLTITKARPQRKRVSAAWISCTPLRMSRLR